MKKKLFIRIVGSAAGAMLVTFSLFYLMQYLIAMAEAKTNTSVGGRIPEFIHLRRDETRTDTKQRALPKKQIIKPPAPPPMSLSTPSNQGGGIAFVAPVAPPSTSGVKLGGPSLGGAIRDSDVIPMFRVHPIFPRAAAQREISGWVVVQFNITKIGTVQNERVLNARPPGVFDQAALAAIRKWKYKPKLVDGKPVPMLGIRKKFSFKLDND